MAGLSATAAAWLRGSVDSLAEAVEEIFTAQLLGKQQAQAANWWLAQGKLGEAWLISEWRGARWLVLWCGLIDRCKLRGLRCWNGLGGAFLVPGEQRKLAALYSFMYDHRWLVI